MLDLVGPELCLSLLWVGRSRHHTDDLGRAYCVSGKQSYWLYHNPYSFIFFGLRTLPHPTLHVTRLWATPFYPFPSSPHFPSSHHTPCSPSVPLYIHPNRLISTFLPRRSKPSKRVVSKHHQDPRKRRRACQAGREAGTLQRPAGGQGRSGALPSHPE